MKIFSLILLSLCLGLVGCSSDSSSGSSEPPAFNPAGTWDTRSNQPQPVLMVTLVLERDPTDPAKISGQWGSQGDDCFAAGSTSGFSGSMSASQITLYLSNEANAGQMTQIRVTLDGVIGTNSPASLSGSYIVTRNDANPECLDAPAKSVLLDCNQNTACSAL